jgi:interleukin-1 receptor-associated kinase 1
MGLPLNEINYIKRQRSSPTEALLDTWGQKNHTVQELFVLLSRMEHYRAMRVLQEFSK